MIILTMQLTEENETYVQEIMAKQAEGDQIVERLRRQHSALIQVSIELIIQALGELDQIDQDQVNRTREKLLQLYHS